jgi:transcriptional antiterminator RfaH
MSVHVASEGSRWYVVQTKPKQEGRAEANLQAWGVPTLAPKVRLARRSHDGEGLSGATPLFPGYLFALFDADTLLAKVRLTRGVSRVVGFGEYATPVDDAIMTIIQGRVQADGFVARDEPEPGDVVEIVEGPLRSLAGVFERVLPARDRVLILLTTVGCRARVQVAKAAVKKVEWPALHPEVMACRLK